MQSSRLLIVSGVGLCISVACQADRTDPDSQARDGGSGRSKAALSTPLDSPASDDDEGGRVVDDGTGPRLASNPPTTRLPGTGGLPTVAKPQVELTQATTAPSSLSPKDRVLADAAATRAGQLISVTFALKDLPADWKAFRAADDELERDAWLQARKAALAPTQQGLVSWLQANGAVKIAPFWIANMVHALVPAEKIPLAATRPDVVGISPDSDILEDEAAWTGKESKDATRITHMYAAGMAGRGGTRSGSHLGRRRPRAMIAFIEQTAPYRAHAAFRKLGWGEACGGVYGPRILFVKDCRDGFNCVLTSETATTDTHGNAMAAIAVGSIERGEDPVYCGTSTTDQRTRSGHLKESYLSSYLIGPPFAANAAAVAVQQATLDGADVINISLSIASDGCNRVADFGGLNAAITGAFNAGVNVVKSAGNGNHDGGSCTVTYPALRRELWVANGIQTVNSDSIGPPNPQVESYPVHFNASLGGVSIIPYGSIAQTPIAIVDSVVGSTLVNYAIPPGNSYGGYTEGSSPAAAITSAFLGALRNMFWANGWSRSPGGIMATALVVADGWNAQAAGDSRTSRYMNFLSGGGRLRAHWPSPQTDLVAPSGWGWRAVTIFPNQTLTWPVGSGGYTPSGVTIWKWAIVWAPSDLSAVPDVDFYVDDICNGGIVTSDTGYDVRVRFRLEGWALPGRCLRMRAVAYSVPPQGVTLYMADYFASNSFFGDH